MAKSVAAGKGELRPTDLKPYLPQRPLVMEEYVDDKGVTRYRYVQRPTKVDDELKARIVAEIADHGRLGTACRKNAVSMGTIKKYIEKDPEFGQAVMEANEAYKDKLIAHHQNLVFNGTVRTSYDRNGNIVSEETIYPVRLIELELKKVDPGYRDKREVDVNVKGGVMVAPSEVSMEDWEKRYASPSVNEVIDGVASEVLSSGHSDNDDEEDSGED
jgi:hypothetical protein